MEKIRIFFLAANPKVSQLGLDEEIREISRWAERPYGLQQALLKHPPHPPHVLHFSGHGTQSVELVFLDNNGNPKPF